MTPALAWGCLLLASVTEAGWALALARSHGFTKLGWSALAVAGIALSVALLAVSMRSIPAAMAYAVWVGIGAALTTAGAVFWLEQPVHLTTWIGVILIVCGVAVLHLK